MADEVRRPDAEVDASIDISFAESFASAEKFADSVSNLDAKLTALVAKLKELPGGLADSLDSTLKQANKGSRAKLDVDAEDITQKLRVALQNHIDAMLKEISFAKVDTGDLESLSKTFSTEAKMQLEKSMKSVETKMRAVINSVNLLDDAMTTYAMEFANSLSGELKGTKDFKRVAGQVQRSKKLLSDTAETALGGLEEAFGKTRKDAQDFNEKLAMDMQRAGMDFEALNFDNTLGSVKNTVQAVNKFFSRMDMLSVNISESLNALIPEDKVGREFGAIDIEAQVREAVRRELSKIVIGSGDEAIVIEDGMIEAKVREAVKSAITGVVVTPTDMEPLNEAVATLIRNLSAQVRGVSINKTDTLKMNMETLADVITDSVIVAVQRGWATADVNVNAKVEIEMNRLAALVADRILDSFDGAVAAYNFSLADDMRQHMEVIERSILGSIRAAVDAAVATAATSESNVGAAVRQTLQARVEAKSVVIPNTDAAIHVEASTVDDIIRKVTANINQRLRSTPVVVDRNSMFDVGIEKDKLADVIGASRYIDSILDARKEAIGYELEKAIMYEESKKDSLYNMVTEIVKGEGGIRRHKGGVLDEEYGAIPKALRRKTGFAADEMTEIINSHLNLGWTEADLYDFFDKNQRQTKTNKKALKEKVIKQVNGEFFDESFRNAMKSLEANLPEALSLEAKALYSTFSPEQQMAAVSRMLSKSKIDLTKVNGLGNADELVKKYDKSGVKPINVTRYRSEIVKALNAENKRIVDMAIAELASGEGDGAATQLIKSSIDYAIDKFAKDYAKAIREITRSAVVAQTISDHLEARVIASVQAITTKNGMRMPQLTNTVKASMQLIIETIENRIAEGILNMKYPKVNVKLDSVIMKAMAEDISKELNTAIVSTSIPNMAGQIKIDEGALRSVLNAIEGVIYRYADNLGRAFALSPAFSVETSGLSARLKETIAKAHGELPDKIANGDLVAAMMAKDAVDIDNKYNKHLKDQIKSYKKTVTEQLDKLTVEPNMELALTFKDDMHDLQNKIYRRIRQIIKAQMEAFDVAINQTIVEPIRTLPATSKKLDVYSKLAQPMVETSRGMERQAKAAQKSAEKARSNFDRAMYGTGMHILTGSLYSVPFYMAYKAKEAIIDLSDYESKIRQNILMSPQSEVNGQMDTTMMNMIYRNQMEPFIGQMAMKYGEMLPETFNAATVVTRRNRPMVEQKLLLNAVMRLKAIDNVDPEEGAAILEAVQSQLKLTPNQVDDVVREIAAAVSVTQATGTDIGETLKRSAVIGHSVGLGSAEMITLASVMAQATGQKGDVIGTFLKTALDRMSKTGTQPVLDKAFERAYEQGILKEKVTVYDEKGNMNSPLKILSTVAQLSGQVPDRDMFEIYRRLFGEWQKGRGVALLGELAPPEGSDTEGTYMNSIKDYLLDLDTMLGKIKSLTAEQEQMLINENMDKAEYYINRLNTSFQLMVRSLSDGGAMEGLKTFSNVLTNIMMAVAKDPEGLTNTLETLLNLLVGFTVYKGGAKVLAGEHGLMTKVSSDFMAGYNYYSPKGMMQKFNVDIERNAQDFMPTLLGSTFNTKNASEMDMLQRAFTQKAVYDSKRAKTLNFLQTRRGMTADAAEQWLNAQVNNRMLKSDTITTKSGIQRQTYQIGKVDLTWMDRLKQMKPNIQDTFNEVQAGTAKTRIQFKGLSTDVTGATGAVKNLGKTSSSLNTLRDAGRGVTTSLLGVGRAIGGMAAQLAIMYGIAVLVEKLGEKAAYSKLTGSQKVDVTTSKVSEYIEEQSSVRAKLMKDLAAKGADTKKLEGTPTEMLLKMVAPGSTNSDSNLAGLSQMVYGDRTIRDADRTAMAEISKLGNLNRNLLNLKYAFTRFGGDVDDMFGRTLDYEALSKALGKTVTSKNVDGIISGYMVNPESLPGYKDSLTSVLKAQKTAEVNADSSIPAGTAAEQEVNRRVQTAIATKSYDSEVVKIAVVGALTRPLKEDSNAKREMEEAVDKELAGYQSKIDQQLKATETGALTDLGLVDDKSSGKDPTSALLEKLNRELGSLEDATSVRELMLKYRGFSDDSNFMKQSMIAQKTSEVGTIKSQLAELKAYQPPDEESALRVQERIAELNRKMWETLVDIKELQKSEGTFNLPEGIRIMSDFEYYRGKGSSFDTTRVTVGDTYYEFNISGIDPNDKAAVQQNVIDPITNAFKNFRKDKAAANALNRQVARGVNVRV